MKEYILPVRDLVVHPGLTVPVYVDNPLSVACIEAATNNHQRIILCPQHSWAYPSTVDDIFTTGTIGEIAQVLHMPDGAIHAIVRTTSVVNLSDISINNGVFSGNITPIEILDDSELEQTIALRYRLHDAIQILSNQRRFKIDKISKTILCPHLWTLLFKWQI